MPNGWRALAPQTSAKALYRASTGKGVAQLCRTMSLRARAIVALRENVWRSRIPFRPENVGPSYCRWRKSGSAWRTSTRTTPRPCCGGSRGSSRSCSSNSRFSPRTTTNGTRRRWRPHPGADLLVCLRRGYRRFRCLRPGDPGGLRVIVRASAFCNPALVGAWRRARRMQKLGWPSRVHPSDERYDTKSRTSKLTRAETAMLRDDRGHGGGRPNTPRNVLGDRLEVCSLNPMTGFFRDGCCDTGREDIGSHTVCAVMTAAFLEFSKSRGND